MTSGSNTGVGPLTVDPGGNPLLGETLCDGNLFVTDSNGALTSTGLSPSYHRDQGGSHVPLGRDDELERTGRQRADV